MGRIFFYYLTVPDPVGGLKQARLMAAQLAALGRAAYLLRDRPPAPGEVDDNAYYGIDVPPAPFPAAEAGRHLRPDDVVLFPEVRLEEALAAARDWRCRKGVNNQNGFYALAERPWPGYRRRGVEFVLVNAPYNAALTRTYLGVPAGRIFLVPHLIVRGPFAPDPPPGPRRLAVCYMPRKRADHVARIRAAVSRAHPDVPWVEIDKVAESEVARRFGDNALFLSTQQREGCPLPALEAMARGCVVAGYAGTERFPHPYATAANGFWADDGDVTGAVAAVGRALALCRAGGPPLDRVRAAGRDTAAGFTEAAVRRALGPVLDYLDGRASGSGLRVPRLGLRGHLDALRILRLAGRLHLRVALRDRVRRAVGL